MTPRTKTIAGVATAAALVVAGAATAQPAYARWSFHDDTVGESIVAPAGGTRAMACEHRLRAVAGYGHFIDVDSGDDPADFPIPTQAFNGVGYKVWKAPASSTGFSVDDQTNAVVFERPDGTTHPATVAGSVTTPPRAELPQPVPANGDPGRSDNYVFTTAPLNVTLNGVKPGHLLGLAPAGGLQGIFVEVRATDCDLPVLDARINLLPGSPDVVEPHSTTDQLPVRVFGSKRLKVRHITEVHLGDAAPVSVGAPGDLDGDGRADRTYVFEQGDTDIQCIDDTVKVTGRTSDRVRFQDGTPITTAGCTG